MPRCTCEFRFYEELNDYLPPEQRKRTITREMTGTPSVKDAIESLGVPHTEIDLDSGGRPVGALRSPAAGRRAHRRVPRVRAVRHHSDPSPETQAAARAALRGGRASRDARALPASARLRHPLRNDLDDAELAALTSREKRILLTRDVGLLKRKAVVRGQWLRSRDPEQQVEEIVEALHLTRAFRPFTRCMTCNWWCLLLSRGRWWRGSSRRACIVASVC